MNEIYNKLKDYMDKYMALQSALTLLEWDNETLAPKQSIEETGKIIGILSDEKFKSLINSDVKKLLAKLETEKEQKTLTDIEKGIIKELRREWNELDKIPPNEYKEYCEFKSKAGRIWSKAKQENNFELFAPALEKLIAYKKKFASCRKKGKEKIYDILLQEFEPGFHMAELDDLFDKLKAEIVPLLQKVVKKNNGINKEYNHNSYDTNKQAEFCRYISGYIGFDPERGVFGESAHPFTTNLHNKDVRYTNHFYENNLESAIFSAIHESGHGMYEQGVADELNLTLAGGGTSMGMHESQSRFFENVIGRSKEFWTPLFPKLQNVFPEQLRNVTLGQFIQGINKAEPGPIRTEADELTYSLHIMVRYEIEKMIFEDGADIKELPEIWNSKYEEYLGIRPKNDAEGILQDVHWSGGDFGYFPSYAIGSAIAAQIYYHMKDKISFDKCLIEGNLVPIREFLRDHIHQFGKLKDSNQLLQDMMQEEFNVDYYIRYLKEKYKKLYQLQE